MSRLEKLDADVARPGARDHVERVEPAQIGEERRASSTALASFSLRTRSNSSLRHVIERRLDDLSDQLTHTRPSLYAVSTGSRVDIGQASLPRATSALGVVTSRAGR